MVLKTPNFRQILKNHGVYVEVKAVQHTDYDTKAGRPVVSEDNQIVRAYVTFDPSTRTLSSDQTTQKEGLIYLDVFDVNSFPTTEPNKITSVTLAGREYNVEFADPVSSGSRVLFYKLWVKA